MEVLRPESAVRVLRCPGVSAFSTAPQVCHLLLAQLHDLLDPTIEGHAQQGHLRVVLRASRTVLRHFHAQLGAKCGAFIEVLLPGEPQWCRFKRR